MLALKPNCEWCDKDLAPDSLDALICTYECTFCKQCVDEVLHNVCPNCGGGFCQRPIRPKIAYRKGVSLSHQPAQTERVVSTLSELEIRGFRKKLEGIDPLDR